MINHLILGQLESAPLLLSRDKKGHPNGQPLKFFASNVISRCIFSCER